MYRSVKGKIASCLGVLGKRRHGVSNNLDPPYGMLFGRRYFMETAIHAQQDRSELATARIEVIYGKKYIVVSHYTGKKDFRKIICDHAFKQALAENKQSA